MSNAFCFAKKEAADAVRAVNARYGYQSELLFVGEQAGSAASKKLPLAQARQGASNDTRAEAFINTLNRSGKKQEWAQSNHLKETPSAITGSSLLQNGVVQSATGSRDAISLGGSPLGRQAKALSAPCS